METLKESLKSTAAYAHWQAVGLRHHHGINIPLFSIHTQNSCGIGEFYDLIPLIDWCSELKLDVIQLLPLNDSGSDPSPYNALSAHALSPIYLSLAHLPQVSKHKALKARLQSLQLLTKTTPRIAYQDVKVQKMAWLRDYLAVESPALLKTQEILTFCSQHGWLEPYALFKVLKDRTEQYATNTWPKEYKSPTHAEYNRLIEENVEEISFYVLLQFLCFQQLSNVKKYAQSKGVYLKGDIPILISPDSCDVWHESELFDTSVAIGAPPDGYNPNGQHWGFPLYKWDLLRASNFAWWRQRLKTASYLYDIYRVDHIIGFFRLWAIPPQHSPKEGYFVPHDEIAWAAQGKELLEMMLNSSSLFPIVEDLGLLIPVVRSTLAALGICGTRVMRWERRGKQDREIIPLNEYPPLSMTTVSTHDSEPLRLWWRDRPDEAKPFARAKGWAYDGKLTKEKLQELLTDSHHTSSLFHINLLGEYLSLFDEMVWPHLEDERINIPGIVHPSNWTYRFRLSLEEITAHEGLKKAMHAIVHGRKRQGES